MIIRKETQKKPKKTSEKREKKKPFDLWELTCETHPWKLMVQNYVRPTNLENHLIGFFLKFQNRGDSQNGKFQKKNLRQFSEPAPKNPNRRFSWKSVNCPTLALPIPVLGGYLIY